MWKNIIKQVLFETKMEMLFPNYKEIVEMIDLPIDDKVKTVLDKPKNYKLVETKSVRENGLYIRDYFLIFNSQTSEFDMLIKYNNSDYYYLWSTTVIVDDIMNVINSYMDSLQLLNQNLSIKLNQMNCLAYRLNTTFDKGIFFNAKYDKDKKTLKVKRLNSMTVINETNSLIILNYLMQFINHPISSDEFRLEIKRINKKMFDEYQSHIKYFNEFLKTE